MNVKKLIYLLNILFILSCINNRKEPNNNERVENIDSTIGRTNNEKCDKNLNSISKIEIISDSTHNNNTFSITKKDVIKAADEYIKSYEYDSSIFTIYKSYYILIGDLNGDKLDDAIISVAHELTDANAWSCHFLLFLNNKGKLEYCDRIPFYCRHYLQDFTHIKNGVIYSTLTIISDGEHKIGEIKYKLIENKLVNVNEKEIDFKINKFEEKENEKFKDVKIPENKNGFKW